MERNYEDTTDQNLHEMMGLNYHGTTNQNLYRYQYYMDSLERKGTTTSFELSAAFY